MKRKNLSLKLAVLLLACGGFGFVSNFANSASVYAMEGKDRQNQNNGQNPGNEQNNREIDCLLKRHLTDVGKKELWDHFCEEIKCYGFTFLERNEILKDLSEKVLNKCSAEVNNINNKNGGPDVPWSDEQKQYIKQFLKTEMHANIVNIKRMDYFPNLPLTDTEKEELWKDLCKELERRRLKYEEQKELWKDVCEELKLKYSTEVRDINDRNGGLNVPLTDEQKQHIKQVLRTRMFKMIADRASTLEGNEDLTNPGKYFRNMSSFYLRSHYPLYCDKKNRLFAEYWPGFERIKMPALLPRKDYNGVGRLHIERYEKMIGGQDDSGFPDLLNSIGKCVEVIGDFNVDKWRVSNKLRTENFSKDEVKRNRELVRAKEKELEEAKKQLDKLSKCSLSRRKYSLSRPAISSSEIASLQKLIEQKWHELNEARKKLPENLHFENRVKKFDDQLNENVVVGVENSIAHKYTDNKLLDAVNTVLSCFKNFYDNVEKKYKEFAERAKDIYQNSYAEHNDHNSARGSLWRHVRAFNDIVQKAIDKLSVCLGVRGRVSSFTVPGLYDLFTDFSDRKADDLTPIELKNKSFFKFLFGEEFAEHCKNEIKKFSVMTLRSYDVLVDNIIDFYNLDPESKMKKIKKMEEKGEEVKPSVLLSLFEGDEERAKRLEEMEKKKKKNKKKDLENSDNLDNKLKTPEELALDKLKAGYEKELGLYPGVELFPENAKLVQLGKKGSKIRAQLKKIKKFNENKGLSGKFGKDLSDEEYLNSGFFEIDAMRYNDDLKAEYLSENKTGVQSKPATLTAPINVINNNLGAEPSANLLPANINDASLEQLQRFRLFLANEYKFNFICDPNNINSLKEALEEHYDEYASKYNKYLNEKNKTGAKPNQASLNANPVLATPINVVNNNNNLGVEPSANLLPANIDEASDVQLQGFMDFLFDKHKIICVNYSNEFNIKEAVKEYYDEYASKYNEYLNEKNKTGDQQNQAKLNANPVLAAPINVVNNNVGVEPSANLLPVNINDASLEQLQRFRLFLANEYKFNFICDPNNVNSLKEALEERYDEYAPKYNEYLNEKNKNGAKPNQASLNASPVLAAPINVVNNNNNVDDKNNLELMVNSLLKLGNVYGRSLLSFRDYVECMYGNNAEVVNEGPDEASAKYSYKDCMNKYLEYLKREVELSSAKLNANSVLVAPATSKAPINAVNNNNNVDDRNNLELKGNVSEIPVEYLNRFRAYVTNNHIYDDPTIARALDLDVVDFVKEYLPKYMNEYYAYLEKNKTDTQPNPVLAAPNNVVNNNVGVDPSVNLLPVNVVGNLDNGNNTENKPKKEIRFITKKRKKTDN